MNTTKPLLIARSLLTVHYQCLIQSKFGKLRSPYCLASPWKCTKIHFSPCIITSGEVSLSFLARSNTVHYLYIWRDITTHVILSCSMCMHTSPMRYLSEPHGIFASPLSVALVRQVPRTSIHTRKSDSLKSQDTFQPTQCVCVCVCVCVNMQYVYA